MQVREIDEEAWVSARLPEESRTVDQEDAELVARAQSGDSAALDILLKRYQPVAKAKAREYFILGADFEDATQEALIGLFKAVRDYDPAHQMPFRVFAAFCARRHVLSALRMGARLKHEPLNRAARVLDDERYPSTAQPGRGSSTCDPAELIIASETIEDLRQLIGVELTDLESEAWEMWVTGCTYRQIADRLEWHVKKVDNALQRVRRKLKNHLDRKERCEHPPGLAPLSSA